MKIKEAFIHLLGGHTLTEYNDMREIATEALSGWQNDIDTNGKEIENLKQSLDKYAKTTIHYRIGISNCLVLFMIHLVAKTKAEMIYCVIV